MGFNRINTIPRWLQSEVQTIAGEIANAPLSQKKYQHLSQKLDQALITLQALEAKEKTRNLFLMAQTKSLKEQVIESYGRLVNRHVDAQVSQIKQESISLKNGRLTIKAVKKLEVHISELEQNHLTSIPDRRVIADAKQALLEAKAKLEGKPVINHIDWLAKQKEVQFANELQLLPGEVEELFDIARAVYNRDFRQAKMRFLNLPEAHKQIFQKHMQNLMATSFEEDSLQVMQAMIATANELVANGESYFSSDQIDQFFLGLNQLGHEGGDSKIVSFAGG